MVEGEGGGGGWPGKQMVSACADAMQEEDEEREGEKPSSILCTSPFPASLLQGLLFSEQCL